MPGDNEDRSGSHGEDSTISVIGSTDADQEKGSAGPSSDGGEFSAGQVIAGRFRIVGRLGGGGMGDVYRADDHELGTSVALKFLPAELSSDPVRLERLRNEVRVARQVAHPNVCRVYDIGDAVGRPFLSMEFIDGEDLASLLRRIGRLPKDKAIELAREICAGVGAAHELGVVHRDLKPANVMIDGRGRARVADFGLASTLDELVGGRDAMAGTPAYMAPEQLAGADATKRTDIYALGLVLYELFTGKRAHDVKTIAGLKERYSSSAPPTSPSDLVEGMDPAVERAIMHCLAMEPEERPASALAVMAALPGGDPLAAMLKAGEMPSPELVAASGRRGTLPLKRALQLGVVVVFGMAVGAWVWGVPSLGDTVGGILAPEVLTHRADVLFTDLGLEIEKVDSAWGFDIDRGLVSRLGTVSDPEWWALLKSEERPVLRFWYRTSPSPMAPWHTSLPGLYIGNVVTPEDPPLTEPGMALVRLGPRGALLELRVAPEPTPRASTRNVDEVLTTITEAVGLDSGQIERIEWPGISPMPGESTVSWRAASSGPEDNPREIVMTLAGARPTWVRIGEASLIGGVEQSARGPDRVSLIFFIFFVGGAVVAGLNVRTGRWDRRGVARLAVVAFVLCFASNLISSHHSLSISEEVRGFFGSVAYGATRALMTCLLYVAIEPFIRRLHPNSLVSWSRLLAGRISDPAVGRDVLVGLTLFVLQGLALAIFIVALGIDKATLPLYAFASGETPLATTSYIASVIRYPVVTLGSTFGFLLIYVFARWILGRFNRAAPVLLWATVFLFIFGTYSRPGLEAISVVTYAAISATASTYLAVRLGVLALVTFQFLQQAALTTVFTLDPTAWYFPPTAIFLILVVAMAVFGIKTSTDQKLLPSRS
jgi:serine/threonine-protein kinase